MAIAGEDAHGIKNRSQPKANGEGGPVTNRDVNAVRTRELDGSLQASATTATSGKKATKTRTFSTEQARRGRCTAEQQAREIPTSKRTSKRIKTAVIGGVGPRGVATELRSKDRCDVLLISSKSRD